LIRKEGRKGRQPASKQASMRSFKKFRDYALQSHNRSKEKGGGNHDHYHLDPPATAALQQPVVQQQPPSSELDEVSRGLQVCLCHWPLLDPLPFFCWSLRVCALFLFMFVLDLISARSLSFFLSFSPQVCTGLVSIFRLFPSFLSSPPSVPPSLVPPRAQLVSAVLLLVYITLGRWGGGEIGADVGKIGDQDCRNGSL
jgi:hypothetical protein